MSEPTNPPQCSGCPLHGKGRGFCVGSGDPKTAKYAIILEAPGQQEIVARATPEEIQIRKRDYPELDDRWLKLGVPVIGPSGGALEWWVWPKLGIKREECYIDNTIRCLAPKGKNGEAYPTGEDRKEAERFCRQYDRVGHFRPNVAVVSLHPASILREVTPLPLLVKDFEKVRDFTAQGRRVLTLLGGKAAHAFLRYGSNVTRWRGHYQELGAGWSDAYKSDFDYQRKKKVKVIVGRPPIVTSEPCKSAKRYKGKSVPKCSCMTCWDRYEQVHKEAVNEISS